MNKNDLVAIRDFLPGDKNFVFATWLRGLYYGDSWFREVKKDVFMDNYHRFIERLLETPGVQVKVACLKNDPEVILGYSVVSELAPVLHWVFVKTAWRGIGIAKSLVPEGVTTITHATKLGLSISKRKDLVFNPWAV